MDRTVKTERSPADDEGRVVRFRPRGGARQVLRWPLPTVRRDAPVDDLSKYERIEGEDDYRHRMTMNALALAATIFLVVAGVWLASVISEMVKTQDCFLSGRRNCAPIDIGPAQRS